MKPSPALLINNIRDARIQGSGFAQFHLFHKYLLSICFMPGSSLSAGDAAAYKPEGTVKVLGHSGESKSMSDYEKGCERL